MGLPCGEEIMIVGRTMWTQSTSVTDGQTDRRMDRITITKTVQRRASHGKNSNGDINTADHPIPIYSVFGSRTGFSGSADRIALFPVSPNSIGMREKQCARSN